MDNYKDFAESTLSAGMDVTTTAMAVADGSKFPSVPFRVVVESEIMHVTSKGSGNDWTVVRGYDSSVADLHPSACKVEQNWTAGDVIERAPAQTPPVLVEASKTLALSDITTVQKCSSASAIVITIPTYASVALPADTEILFVRYGVGGVTFAGDAGVTLNSSSGKKSINKQYEAVTLKKMGADEWLLIGSLTT